jgi:hypothetical protein
MQIGCEGNQDHWADKKESDKTHVSIRKGEFDRRIAS